MIRIAILDDYQDAARRSADWPPVRQHAEITVFHHRVVGEDALAERLAPFDAVCVMRERTPLTESLMAPLPKPRFVGSNGAATPRTRSGERTYDGTDTFEPAGGAVPARTAPPAPGGGSPSLVAVPLQAAQIDAPPSLEKSAAATIHMPQHETVLRHGAKSSRWKSLKINAIARRQLSQRTCGAQARLCGVSSLYR